MTFGGISSTLAADASYSSVEAGEIVCSAHGILTDKTVATRVKVGKDTCFMTKYPIPSGTHKNKINYCMFCGASD